MLLLAVNGGDRPKIPADAPADLRSLAACCWAQNPADRPTFQLAMAALERSAGHKRSGSNGRNYSRSSSLASPKNNITSSKYSRSSSSGLGVKDNHNNQGGDDAQQPARGRCNAGDNVGGGGNGGGDYDGGSMSSALIEDQQGGYVGLTGIAGIWGKAGGGSGPQSRRNREKGGAVSQDDEGRARNDSMLRVVADGVKSIRRKKAAAVSAASSNVAVDAKSAPDNARELTKEALDTSENISDLAAGSIAAAPAAPADLSDVASHRVVVEVGDAEEAASKKQEEQQGHDSELPPVFRRMVSSSLTPGARPCSSARRLGRKPSFTRKNRSDSSGSARRRRKSVSPGLEDDHSPCEEASMFGEDVAIPYGGWARGDGGLTGGTGDAPPRPLSRRRSRRSSK